MKTQSEDEPRGQYRISFTNCFGQRQMVPTKKAEGALSLISLGKSICQEEFGSLPSSVEIISL